MVSSDVISRIFDHDCGSIEEFQRRLVATQLALGWSENSILSPIARAVIIPKQPGASLVLHGLQISAGQAVITQRRCETLKNQLAKDLIDETLTDAMFCTKLAGYGCTLLVDSYSIPGPRDKVPMVCMAIVYPSEGGNMVKPLCGKTLARKEREDTEYLMGYVNEAVNLLAESIVHLVVAGLGTRREEFWSTSQNCRKNHVTKIF